MPLTVHAQRVIRGIYEAPRILGAESEVGIDERDLVVGRLTHNPHLMAFIGSSVIPREAPELGWRKKGLKASSTLRIRDARELALDQILELSSTKRHCRVAA